MRKTALILLCTFMIQGIAECKKTLEKQYEEKSPKAKKGKGKRVSKLKVF